MCRSDAHDSTADDRLDESEAMADEAEAVESVVLVWACFVLVSSGCEGGTGGGEGDEKEKLKHTAARATRVERMAA